MLWLGRSIGDISYPLLPLQPLPQLLPLGGRQVSHLSEMGLLDCPAETEGVRIVHSDHTAEGVGPEDHFTHRKIKQAGVRIFYTPANQAEQRQCNSLSYMDHFIVASIMHILLRVIKSYVRNTT
ncbi:MAG: hypothetical protein D6698_14640 [Gammaproteobacteria bacterium]|nr:MAG: hypothetical protein D6698_14640 [Gammaproteobacteria bacterium]